MKMRKSGVILCVLFFIVAIVLFLFFYNKDKDVNVVVDTTTPAVTEGVSNTTKPNSEVTNPEANTTTPTETTKPVEKIVEKVITKEVSSIKTINEGSLTESINQYEVITVIANKRIILLDESPDTKDKKMLTYCFDVLTPDNKPLILFVTKSVYNQYKIEDKLKVVYDVYKNDVGVEFPIVSSVSAVDK